MSAFVEHSFEGGFLLDESRLRKLKDIVESREIKNYPESKIVYRVFRGDSYSYETESVDDVVNEDNEDWRRITRLGIRISRPGKDDDEKVGIRFLLSFSDKEGCALRIAAEDRDRVFLLFSDLRDYVQNEITVTRTIDEESIRFASMMFFLLIMTFAFAATLFVEHSHSPNAMKEALKSPDLANKINYLIEGQGVAPTSKAIIAAFAGLILLAFTMLTGAPRAIIRFVFPGNVFLFGKRKERFEKRQRLTSNLLWIVGVGLVVSTLAGLVVWRFTNSR